MSDFELPEKEIARCDLFFKAQLNRDEEREREYLTYEELKVVLEELLDYKFKRDHIFFKMISELENAEPNKISFNDLLTIYAR